MDDIRQYLHGARDDDRSVLNFLAKVDNAVRTEAAPQNVDLAREIRCAHVVPPALVLEVQEDLAGRILLAEDPERYHDDEEAKNVPDEACSLELWEERLSVRVEQHRHEDHCPHDKHYLP